MWLIYWLQISFYGWLLPEQPALPLNVFSRFIPFSVFSSSVFFPSCCLDRLQRLCLIQIFSFTWQHGIVEMSRGVVGGCHRKTIPIISLDYFKHRAAANPRCKDCSAALTAPRFQTHPWSHAGAQRNVAAQQKTRRDPEKKTPNRTYLANPRCLFVFWWGFTVT